MRSRQPLSGPILLCLLASGCSQSALVTRQEVVTLLPPAALVESRAEPACRADRNRDLVRCIIDLREWGRLAEADKASLRAWRDGAEQAAGPPQEAQEARPWWRPW